MGAPPVAGQTDDQLVIIGAFQLSGAK